jgi:hypothetical protein
MLDLDVCTVIVAGEQLYQVMDRGRYGRCLDFPLSLPSEVGERLFGAFDGKRRYRLDAIEIPLEDQ